MEQSQGNPKRSGFSAEQINSSDNITRTPRDIHHEITAEYNRRALGGSGRFRDMLDGLSWEEQYKIGCDMLEEKLRRKHASND